MTPAERAMGRYMRAPDGHEAGGGALDGGADAAGGSGGEGGAAADVIGAVFGASGGEGGGDGAGDGAGGGDGGSAEWRDAISADAIEGEELSHREWIEKAGFKDMNAVVKSLRDTQRALRAGGKIDLPAEGATPEQIEAFHKAIGRPDAPDGYEIALPEGVEGELDARLLGSFREAAFAAGVPAPMARALGDWFIQQQLDSDAAMVRQRDQEVADTFKEWGAQKDANLSLCNRAAARLGLDPGAVADIQKGFGAGRTLKLLQQLGAGLAEDAMMDGGGRGSFGVTAAEARSQLDQMLADKATVQKIFEKDPATLARKTRLEAAIAAEMDRKQRAA